MREIGRVQQGFYPTQDRIVRAVANLFKLPANPIGHITVLDAGCGTGQAIHELRKAWQTRAPNLNAALLGIDSDKHRYEQAAALLASGNGGGTALWSAIEDATVDQPVSLLWFNPPYDRIRGAGRTEAALFNRVKEWPARNTGLLLMIVPDYVLADVEVGLAIAVERDYELLGLWRYPEPEYQDFKQCVLLARRREKALNKTLMMFPRWAAEPSKWPVLRDDLKPVATLQPVQKVVTLRRTRLGNDVIVDAVSRSPLRSGLLREAAAPAPPIGRPLLPLKHGHLALALAGGLCDGVIESCGNRFLIKGTLTSAIRRISTKDQVDADGGKVAEIDTYRTRYEMNVRCLRSDGSIENYTSAEPAAEELETEVSEV
ncbi:MAG: DUF6094 domain-containing protein [Planctomycetota bacterium]